METQVIRVQDRYNPIKVWIVKRDSNGHYYMNQEIAGKLFYSKYVRTTKKYLISIGVLN